MKSVTEFPNFILSKGLQAKTSLVAEGKTPEEIQQSLGETFKYDGDKLKYFVNSLEVADQNSKDLKRVVVMSLGEGESAPSRGVKVEELYYVPEYIIQSMKISQPKTDGKGGRGKGRGGPGGGGMKESPWGLSPEEKAAKKGKSAGKAAEAKNPKV